MGTKVRDEKEGCERDRDRKHRTIVIQQKDGRSDTERKSNGQ